MVNRNRNLNMAYKTVNTYQPSMRALTSKTISKIKKNEYFQINGAYIFEYIFSPQSGLIGFSVTQIRNITSTTSV
jgi:hypothetical protein